MKTVSRKAVVIFALSAVSGNAFAADNWLSCNGNVSTIPYGAKTASATEVSERVLAFNDEEHKLYQWSAKRNSLDPVPVSTYAPNKITWGVDMMNASGMSWQGSLDRTTMKVDINYKDRDGVTMVWKEQCRPTAPLIKDPGGQVATTKD